MKIYRANENKLFCVQNILQWKQSLELPPYEVDDEDNELAIKTCHDLSWAILNYGSQRPTYRKKGERCCAILLAK